MANYSLHAPPGAKLTSVGSIHGAEDYAYIDVVIDTLRELVSLTDTVFVAIVHYI